MYISYETASYRLWNALSLNLVTRKLHLKYRVQQGVSDMRINNSVEWLEITAPASENDPWLHMWWVLQNLNRV
jgi:hypothetical protein